MLDCLQREGPRNLGECALRRGIGRNAGEGEETRIRAEIDDGAGLVRAGAFANFVCSTPFGI